MKWTQERIAEAVRLREAGKSYSDIALTLGCSRLTVAKMIKDYQEHNGQIVMTENRGWNTKKTPICTRGLVVYQLTPEEIAEKYGAPGADANTSKNDGTLCGGFWMEV